MKKRIMMLFLATSLALTAVACGDGGNNSKKEKVKDVDDALSEVEDLMDDEEWKDAIDLCEKIINTDEECEDAYIYMARCYEALDKHDKAIKTLEKGLKKTDSKKIQQEYDKLTGAVSAAPAEEYVETASAVTEAVAEEEYVEEATSYLPEDGVYIIDQVVYEEDGIEVVCDSYDSYYDNFNFTIHSSIDYRDSATIYIYPYSVNNMTAVSRYGDFNYYSASVSGTQDVELVVSGYGLSDKYDLLEVTDVPFMNASFYITCKYTPDGGDEVYRDMVEADVETMYNGYVSLSDYYGDKVEDLDFSTSYAKDNFYLYDEYDKGDYFDVYASLTADMDFYMVQREDGNYVLTVKSNDAVYSSNVPEVSPQTITDRSIEISVYVDDEERLTSYSYVVNDKTDIPILIDLNEFRTDRHIPEDQPLKLSVKVGKLYYDETESEPYEVVLGEY